MIRKKRGRALTRRQKGRIAASQEVREKKLAQHDAQPLPEVLDVPLGEQEEGLVIAHYGLNIEVEDHQGARLRCVVRKSVSEEPVCGDRVIWQRAGQCQGVISGILARSSLIQRPLSYQRLQTIAANVERIFVVTTANMPNFGLLDRYLVAAEVAGIDAAIIVNKIDLVEELPPLQARFAHYERMAYPLFFTSIQSLVGISELMRALTGSLSVLVGQSGTGKTSLACQWISSPTLKVGRVNSESGKGRHTTTVASLYHLPAGGSLIDSPGIREFGLHSVTAATVGGFFRDIASHYGQCRFSDCQHEDEPSCAVQKAVQSGIIHAARLTSLQNIQASLEVEKLF